MNQHKIAVVAVSKAVLIPGLRPSVWVMTHSDQPWFAEANRGFRGVRLFSRDAALHAIQACIPHRRVLPTRIDKLTILAMEAVSGPRTVHAIERLRAGNEFVYDLEITNSEGELLERWEGLHLRAIETLPAPTAWPCALLGPYLERRLEEIGPTNALAETECRELEERFETLRTQLQDIAAAREDLEQLIAKLREEEESRYEAVFGAVAANFHEYFSQLAPGGRATLKHADGDEGPRTGVEILVQPPRKRLQNVTLLSSGERSLAALALVLALDEVNPSPFTILDEVDAALDDANVGRFGEMLARLGTQRQFLVITHNHVTMSHASTLYGIHLDESGSSHLVSVRLEDIRKPIARAATTAQAV